MSFPEPPYAQPPQGAQYSPPNNAPVGAPVPYRASTKSRIIVWTIAAVLAAPVVAIAGNFAYNLIQARPAADPNEGLITACHDGVGARLKTPATATFSKHEQVSAMSDTRSKVVGYVDAQNLYGAMVRHQYTCEADRDHGGWKVFQVYFADS